MTAGLGGSGAGPVKLARRIWASCVLITLCMGSFGPGGLALGFAVCLLVSLAAIEPALLRQRFARLPMLLAAALYLLWTLVSLAWAEPAAYAPLLAHWSHWIVLLSAAGCMMTDEVRHGLWRAFLAVQVIVALWAVYLAIDCLVQTGGTAGPQSCIQGRIPHGSLICGWMLSLSALIALLWLQSRARWYVAGVLLLAILLIAEPVAWILALIGMGIALREVPHLGVPRLALAGGVVASMLAALLLLPGEPAQLVRLQASGDRSSEEQSTTQAQWRVALEAAAREIARSPFVGQGLGAWSQMRAPVGAGSSAQDQSSVPSPASEASSASSASSAPDAPKAASAADPPSAPDAANPPSAPSAYVLIVVEGGFIGLLLFLGLLVSLWQAGAWLVGWEATVLRILVASMAAGCLFQPWSNDPSAARLFLVLLLLLFSGLRAPSGTSPSHPSASPGSARSAKSARPSKRFREGSPP